MHNALDRRVAMIADRIGVLAGLYRQFFDARNILPRDRITGIVGSISAATAGVTATA